MSGVKGFDETPQGGNPNLCRFFWFLYKILTPNSNNSCGSTLRELRELGGHRGRWSPGGISGRVDPTPSNYRAEQDKMSVQVTAQSECEFELRWRPRPRNFVRSIYKGELQKEEAAQRGFGFED